MHNQSTPIAQNSNPLLQKLNLLACFIAKDDIENEKGNKKLKHDERLCFPGVELNSISPEETEYELMVRESIA